MGMFDTIYLECPECGKKNELQTKWGPCVLGEYTIEDAPIDAMEKFVQNSVECEYCECEFKVEVVTKPQYRVVKVEEEEEDPDCCISYEYAKSLGVLRAASEKENEEE